MRKQLRYIFTFTILGLLGLFAWQTKFVYIYVIEPIARVLWLFYSALRSVDQETYWLLLAFIALLFIFRVLPESKEFSSKPPYENSKQKLDRVLYWETLIKAAEADQYDRIRLQRSLEILSQSIRDLSFTNDQVVILLPIKMTGFRGWIQQASYLLPLFRHNQQKKTHCVTELEIEIDQILKSMETQMESTYD